ncbi:MAG: hypothetical protein K9I85_11645 [Saprospiraceae bacterium]|nr:hypothetical protein [Saprospiraceae bacterium]
MYRMLPFATLPPVPEEVSTTNVLSRVIDGLGFRYRWATEDLTEDDLLFRPVESSMTIQEVMVHIYDLAYSTNRVFGGDVEKDNSPDNQLRERTLQLYVSLSQRLREMDDPQFETLVTTDAKYPFWYWLNGPIADALTHVGQITSWRRMAGNPQPAGVDVFRGTKQ